MCWSFYVFWHYSSHILGEAMECHYAMVITMYVAKWVRRGAHSWPGELVTIVGG